MEEMRILSPTGVCGSGFVEESFEKALAQKPHFIGCDGGSTDPGPSHLGSGQPAFPREAVASRYGLEQSQVKFFYCDNALAVKAFIPRPCFQGDLRDADGHGGQQYAPLMDIEIP